MYLKNSTSNNEIVNYAKEYFIIRTSNKKLLTKNIKGLHTHNDINITNIDDGYLNNIRIYFKREINISKVFNSVIFNGIKYNSKSCLTKFKDCYVISKDNKLGYIEFFFIENDEVYAYVRLILNYRTFKATFSLINELDSNLGLCNATKEGFFITKLHSIEKFFAPKC